MEDQIPVGFEDALGDFGPQLYDGYCGEPIAWGFPITKYLGTERWEELKQLGAVEYGSWDSHAGRGRYYFITRWLTREEAEQTYGPVTEEEYGPQGGWKSVVFGDKRFLTKHLERRLSNEERQILMRSRAMMKEKGSP